MPLIKFNNLSEVAEHPQAKLLGWELLSSLFNKRLNELEVSMLEKGVDEIGLGNFLSLNSETKKQRLLICAVLSDVSPQSIRDLYDLAKQDNNISKKTLAETFLLNGDINVINACFSELNEAEVRSLALRNFKFYLKELALRGALSSMAFLLNYQLSNGHSIKELVTTADQQDFYRLACSNGHLNIIEHLEGIEGFDKNAAAEARNYQAYSRACENGHLNIIEHLDAIEGFDKKAAAKADDYAVYRKACSNGHLNIIEHLEAIEGFDKKAAAEANNYAAYSRACENGHLNIIEHLQQIPSVLAYAEKHDHEYGIKHIYPFVSAQLSKLEQEKNSFGNTNFNGVFDVDNDTAEFYFIVLRNLIRRSAPLDERGAPRNQEELSNEILFLLSIPAIRGLCHQTVNIGTGSPGEENELLKLAYLTSNREAADILLGLPDVFRLAEQSDFYRANREGRLDLRRLAQDRESSMVALSEGERETVEKVTRHYQASINEKGSSNAVFDEFISLLKSEYEQNPASISISNTAGEMEVIQLPLEWNELQVLKTQLTHQQYQEALEVYSKHDSHTTLRYLSKPNKWMHNQASYVYVMHDEQGNRTTERYSTFEDYKQIIALFYMASHDEATPAIDGQTLKTRKENFIKELALIGRAHNWDNNRPVLDERGNPLIKNGTEITEEYDDLDFDRPSCYSGVNRRLFQSVLGHGLFKTVTTSIIKQAMNEQVSKYFKDNISWRNARALKEAYDGIVEMEGDTEVHMKTLERLNIPDNIKARIIMNVSEQLSNVYKENFDKHKNNFQKIMTNYLKAGSNHQPDIMAFNESISLTELIEKRAADATTGLSCQFFPSPKEKGASSDDIATVIEPKKKH